MKSILIIFITILPFISTSAQAEQENIFQNELSVSYGVLPITAWDGIFSDIINPISTGVLDDARTANTICWGAMNLSYQYKANAMINIGCDFTFSSIYKDIYDPNLKIGHITNYFFSILPGIKIQWTHKPLVNTYSRINFGVTIASKNEYYQTLSDHHDTQLYFAWQITPLGVEIGKRLSGFIELGIGNMGSLLAGARYRF